MITTGDFLRPETRHVIGSEILFERRHNALAILDQDHENARE